MSNSIIDFKSLAENIKSWGKELGFQGVGITDVDLAAYQPNFINWLKQRFHGEMQYMEQHGNKRYEPAELIPGTLRVITARIDYLPPKANISAILKDSSKGYISRYALGRDYHKLVRKRLNVLAEKITSVIDTHAFRVFADSAPVLEKPLAEKAGLGWIGKNTNLINRQAGSWFFLGEIFTNLPLPLDSPVKNHCGTCHACIDICPTQAIIGPYQLDARKCISYLTIELRGSIPVEFRAQIGNRIYGCDDCQLVCPWNRFAKPTDEKDFHPRHGLSSPQLLDLFSWTEEEFLKKTEGSAIRRIGYECWQRNIAIALGNANFDLQILKTLQKNLNHPSAIVREHVIWVFETQEYKKLKLSE